MDRHDPRRYDAGKRAATAYRLFERGMPIEGAVARAQSTLSGLQDFRALVNKHPDLATKVEQGEITLSRAKAMTRNSGLRRDRLFYQNFDSGDRWTTLFWAWKRYADTKRTPGQNFVHVSPKVARKRLQQIQLLRESLDVFETELRDRAQIAQTSIATH